MSPLTFLDRVWPLQPTAFTGAMFAATDLRKAQNWALSIAGLAAARCFGKSPSASHTDKTVTNLMGGNHMNALELLKEDHRKVHELFEQVKATESQKQHKQLFRKIKTELDTHAHIEEKVFYPTLKKYEEFKETVLEALEEHLQMKTLLRAIDRLSEGAERFDAKLKVLIDDVEHHVEEEEGELFPKVERQFSSERLEELGMELEAAKKDFGGKPRARAASSR
jgi:hemerythrin superfamily protein